MTTTDDLIARAQAVLDAAEKMTPGPWRWGDPDIDPDREPVERRSILYHAPAGRLSRPVLWLDPSSQMATMAADCDGLATLRNDAPAVIRDLLARLADQARGLTVGAALADPRVQDGSHVAEYSGEHDVAEYRQTRVDAGGFRIWSRWRLADRWGPWRDNGNTALDGCDVRKPCRLVPLADADRNPAERGPL